MGSGNTGPRGLPEPPPLCVISCKDLLGLVLRQQFSVTVVFALRGHLAMTGDLFGHYIWGLCWHLVGGDWEPVRSRAAPQQRASKEPQLNEVIKQLLIYILPKQGLRRDVGAEFYKGDSRSREGQMRALRPKKGGSQEGRSIPSRPGWTLWLV